MARRFNTVRDVGAHHDPEILTGLVRGPWAIYWQNREEERGRSFSGENVYDVAPAAPRWVETWGKKLANAIVALNGGASLDQLYRAARAAGFSKDRETFGAYLGLQVVGTGQSWTDDFSTEPDLKIVLPQTELYQDAEIDLRFAK